jgi:8-oxo-dGTP pyrophosphatase MutT (NUDIX family)
MKEDLIEIKVPRLRSRNRSLPLQVAAVCYRARGSSVEFLLVNTNGSGKWTFPKGRPGSQISHSQAAEREAMEEAGAIGTIQARHFHLYIHSKGVFWKGPGVQEFVVKAFLLEVREVRRPDEAERNPTWFSADDAKRMLAKGRESKYRQELNGVIDRAVEQIQKNLPAFPNGSKLLTRVPTGTSRVLDR